MIIQDYTGWPTNVNRVILDSTTIKIGDEALKNDTLESGLKRSAQRNSFIPDIFPVVMEFDWENKDIKGETEYTRFVKWYKYVHKFGQVPFEFPQILYSPVTGITVADEKSKNYKVEYYKITTSLDGSKSGTKIKIPMTWKSVYSGVVQVEEEPEQILDLSMYSNHCRITFSREGNVTPVSNNFNIYIDGSELPNDKLGFYYGDSVAKIYYAPLSKGKHSITFSYQSPSLTVDKDQFLATVIL